MNPQWHKRINEIPINAGTLCCLCFVLSAALLSSTSQKLKTILFELNVIHDCFFQTVALVGAAKSFKYCSEVLQKEPYCQLLLK